MINFVQIYNNIESLMKCLFSASAIIAVPGIIAALLIPIAIFVIDNNKNDDIDKDIITNKIFFAKWYVPYFIIGSLSLLVVDGARLLSLIYIVVLALFTMYILSRVYKWVSVKETEDKNDEFNFKQRMRYEFYTSQKNDSDRVKVWKIVLENLNSKNQSNLITALVDTLEQMDVGAAYKANQDRVIHILLANFDKLRFVDLDEFKKLVKFAFQFYVLENQREKGKKDGRPAFAREQLLDKMLEYSVSKRNNNYSMHEYAFFEELDNILREDEIDFTYFLTNMLNTLGETCVKYEKSVNSVFEYNKFFKRIEIVQDSNLSDRDRKIINAYLNVTGDDVLQNDIKGRDARVVDGITEKIFQGVDLITWFTFYTFEYCRIQFIDGKDELYSKIVTWCENHREVGVFGRMDSSVMSVDREEIKDDQEAHEYIMKQFAEQARRERFNAMKMVNAVFESYGSVEYFNNILATIKKIKQDKYFGNSSEDKIKKHRLSKLEKTFEEYRELMLS